MKHFGLSILIAMLGGCAVDGAREPAPVTTADASTTPDAGPSLDPDAGPIGPTAREPEWSMDGALHVMETTVSDEVREAFPGAAAYYVEVEGGGDVARIHLLDDAGGVLELIRLDLTVGSDGSETVRASFPSPLPENCFAPPCPWETPTGSVTDALTIVRRGSELRVDGRVGTSTIGAQAVIGGDGTLERLTSTTTVPPREEDTARLDATMWVVRDIRDLIGTGPFDPSSTSGAGCTIGKMFGWAVVGGLTAGCCYLSAGVACGICSSAGAVDAGLISELC